MKVPPVSLDKESPLFYRLSAVPAVWATVTCIWRFLPKGDTIGIEKSFSSAEPLILNIGILNRRFHRITPVCTSLPARPPLNPGQQLRWSAAGAGV